MFSRKIAALCVLVLSYASVAIFAADGPAPLVPPASATDRAEPAPALKKFKVLVLTQSMGFKHSAVTRPGAASGKLSVAENTIAEIGRSSGVFDAECIQDASQISAAKLQGFDALIFYTSGDLPIAPDVFSSLQTWLRSGKAFVGIHSATDTFKEFRPYYEMLGATYLRHPWNHGATVVNLDPEHAATKMFPSSFDWSDELCEQQYFDARKVRVLLALDMANSVPKVPKMVPISWVREYGKGRVFYTNFGNAEAVWNDTYFRAHLLGGIRWSLKLDPGSADPNTEITAKEESKARLAVFETEKSWLAKAAKTAGADPAAAVGAALKLATDDKAAYLKLHDAIGAARADELKREAALKPKQRPTDADVKAVVARRVEVVGMVVPAK